jgi:hypothetical protein
MSPFYCLYKFLLIIKFKLILWLELFFTYLIIMEE